MFTNRLIDADVAVSISHSLTVLQQPTSYAAIPNDFRAGMSVHETGLTTDAMHLLGKKTDDFIFTNL
jgi:hypothetical protein